MRKFEVVPSFENKGIKLPHRSTKYSAGYDFYIIEDIELEPYKTYLVPTGIRAKMETDDFLSIHVRSSTAKNKGVILKNQTAIVDCDYYNADNFGHIQLMLFNISDEVVKLKKGDKIVQGIFEKYLTTDDDSDTLRDVKRNGGYGSTGDK